MLKIKSILELSHKYGLSKVSYQITPLGQNKLTFYEAGAKNRLAFTKKSSQKSIGRTFETIDFIYQLVVFSPRRGSLEGDYEG